MIIDELNPILDTSAFPLLARRCTPATPEQEAELERREKARQDAEEYYRYTHCGVPFRYHRHSFSTFQTADADAKKQAEKERILSFLQNDFMPSVLRGDMRFLALLGGYGIGKTHLAAATLRNCSGEFRMSSTIVSEIRMARSYAAKRSEADILREYSSSRLLVIDEVGRADNAADEKYMLYQIINARYNAQKSLVVTANMDLSKFLDYIGGAASDRFTENGDMKELKWDSYRIALRQVNV